jgi:hypothetical protein
VVNPGDTWGLAHVRYLVDPAAPLGTVVPMVLEQFPQFLPSGGTSLTDANGNPVLFSGLGTNGTITVVPEPASFTMLAMSGVAVVTLRRFRTSRS